MIEQNKTNLGKYLIIIILSGFILRIYNNFNQIFWNDEIYTLFITDPLTSYSEFLNRHEKIDENPILYFFLLRFINYINYSPEFIRFTSILFSSLTIILSIKFFNIFLDKKKTLYCVLLVSFNIFLIWQSKEGRIASSIVFFSLINIIIFFRYIEQKKIKYSIILFLINLFCLSFYPFLILIIMTQYFYILVNKKKIIKLFTLNLLFTIIIYFFLNYDYILLKVSKESHHFNLELTFFFNYFFRSFFGSIIFGGLTLIIFSLGMIKTLLKKRNEKIIFNIYLIIISYSFAILYTFIKDGGVIAPRYFIFLLPSIIIIIVNFLSLEFSKKFLLMYLILTISNTLILFDKWKIEKPNTSYLLQNIDSGITVNFTTDEGGSITDKDGTGLYDQYFKYSLIMNNNLKYIDIKNIQKLDKFYFICLDHARMHVGNNKKIQDNNKCKRKLDNFKIVSQKKILDFQIILFSKY